MGLLRDSKVATRHGGGPIKRARIDSIGNHRQSPGIQTRDPAAEAEHSVRDANGAGGQERRQAIERPMPSLSSFGHPETADNPWLSGPGRRQSRREVGMEQEALHQLGAASAQRMGQPRHGLQGPVPAACQALARKASLANNFSQAPFFSQGDNCRRPTTPVQPRGQVHQRPLSTANIEVGDDQGNPDRDFRSRT
jgi:hypothetical protein